MACDPVTYQTVTQAVFDCFKQNALSQGVQWNGNGTGSFSKTQTGVTVTTKYWFDPTAATLKLQVVEKPFFISCDFLYGRFHQGLEVCGAQQPLRF